MKELTLGALAELTESKLIGNPSHLIKNVSDLEGATSDDVSFFSNPNYEKAMLRSRAGAVFVSPTTNLPEGRNFLVHPKPSEAFQITIKYFYEGCEEISSHQGIHKTAIIHPSAKIGELVNIGPHVTIEKDVVIGDRTTILAGSYIGPHVVIGADCTIYSLVTIRGHSRLGNRVILQPGVVIGSCGFGYIQDNQGRHLKLEQLGNVELGDDVEVGANTTIDRGRFKTTRIGNGTKIDNLVQIGHGVEIGRSSMVIGLTGIAGSTKIGNHVILAGQVGVAGHLTIADQVVVAACSGVSKSLEKPGKYGGLPAVPLHQYNRNAAQLRNVGALVERLSEIEAQLKALQDAIANKDDF